ncbi:6-bladed beta-propeller [Gemmatimonas aurantiaca]|uniref:6-bladed beta-propeller n=1 Tax=Gemmatimonas aurantiaca TaxID=173480 RepID=UPI00301C8BC7
MNRHAAVCVVSSLCVLLSCGGADGGQSKRPGAPTAPALFRESFLLTDSLELESTDQSPIVRISGLAIDHAGRIVLADASERTVRIHAPDGRLLKLIGRSGDGPGEFREPRFIMALSGNELAIGEGTGKLHVFRNDSLVRTQQLEGLTFVSSFSHDPSRGMLVAIQTDGEKSSLYLYDVQGKLLKSIPVVANKPAPDQPLDPRWNNVYQAWSTTCGDGHAYVATTISDSVWRVALDDGAIASQSAAYVGYSAPVLPDPSAPVDRAKLFGWIKKYDAVQGIMCERGQVGFTFVRGTRNYGDPQVFMLREGDRWQGYSEALPVVAFRGDTLLALLNASDKQERFWIGKYVRR